MDDQQTEPRFSVDLPVRVWGMTAAGRPFSQSAHALNISSAGALISGVESVLKVGDVIGVQFKDRKTRCTVLSVINTGPVRKNQVGIELVGAQDCPWKSYLPLDSTTATIAAYNTRRWPRHKILFPVELRAEHAKAPIRINASDVSGNGCYVESMMPFPLGTSLQIGFWLDSEHISISAAVRTSDPGVGNGIEFTGMSAGMKDRMQAYLDLIDPPMEVPDPEME
jgi:PilZ domain